MTWQEALQAWINKTYGPSRGYARRYDRTAPSPIKGCIVLDEPLFTDMEDDRFVGYEEPWVLAREGSMVKMWSLGVDPETSQA